MLYPSVNVCILAGTSTRCARMTVACLARVAPRNLRHCAKYDDEFFCPLLEFLEDRKHWGYKFRFGLFSVCDADMRLIAHAMRVNLQWLNL